MMLIGESLQNHCEIDWRWSKTFLSQIRLGGLVRQVRPRAQRLGGEEAPGLRLRRDGGSPRRGGRGAGSGRHQSVRQQVIYTLVKNCFKFGLSCWQISYISYIFFDVFYCYEIIYESKEMTLSVLVI